MLEHLTHPTSVTGLIWCKNLFFYTLCSLCLCGLLMHYFNAVAPLLVYRKSFHRSTFQFFFFSFFLPCGKPLLILCVLCAFCGTLREALRVRGFAIVTETAKTATPSPLRVYVILLLKFNAIDHYCLLKIYW